MHPAPIKMLLLGDESPMRHLLALGLSTPHDESLVLCSLSELGRCESLRTLDVALIDWEMRTSDAHAVMARLRRLAPLLPIVVLTARCSRLDEARGLGASETLLKPLDIPTAREAFARAMRPPVPPPEPRPPVPSPLPVPPPPQPEPVPVPPPGLKRPGPEVFEGVFA